jgi:hypothetical protein
MNYALHYQRLMEKAERRVLTVYCEKHHVVPKCLDKTSKYTVKLTPEEHYVAHQLLVKMYPGHRGLIAAAIIMTGPHADVPYRRCNKLYGWLRRAQSVMRKGKKYPVTEKQRAHLTRIRATPEFKAAQREGAVRSNIARGGQPLSEKQLSGLTRVHAGIRGRKKPDTLTSKEKYTRWMTKRALKEQLAAGQKLSQPDLELVNPPARKLTNVKYERYKLQQEIKKQLDPSMLTRYERWKTQQEAKQSPEAVTQ